MFVDAMIDNFAISKRRKIILLTAFTLSMALCLGPLIHPLPAAEKREVRELEKCALKLAKSGCSLLFNGACLRENITICNNFVIPVILYLTFFIINFRRIEAEACRVTQHMSHITCCCEHDMVGDHCVSYGSRFSQIVRFFVTQSYFSWSIHTSLVVPVHCTHSAQVN